MTAFRELDTVVLTHDLPDVGLCAGDIGVIVQLYPTDAVEVEFVTASGGPQALLTLRGTDVRGATDSVNRSFVHRFALLRLQQNAAVQAVE